MVAHRFLRLGLFLFFALLLLPFQPAAGAGRSVGIGPLPPTTRANELVVRGRAPAGSLVMIAVNGQIVSRQPVEESLPFYRARVNLEPGRNWITVRVEGSPLVARTLIHRLTASLPELGDGPVRTDYEILATLGLLPSGPLRPDEPLTRDWLDQFLRDVGLPVLPAGPGGSEALVSRGELVTAAVGALPRPPLGPNAIRESYLRRLNRPVPAEAPAALLPFSDADEIPPGVREAVVEAVERGLLDPYGGGAFRADDPAMRWEAVVVIRRLLDQASGPS